MTGKIHTVGRNTSGIGMEALSGGSPSVVPTPKRVGVLYTGGTIGMKSDLGRPLPVRDFVELLITVPGFSRPPGNPELRLDLALNREGTEVIALEFLARWKRDPIDSSQAEPEVWIEMAECLILTMREKRFDGYVVVHGTDTLAWTASALSFLLGGVAVPVVVTGSQTPLGDTRTDGVRNLVTALEFAAKITDSPEVSVFFDDRLLRGNRTTKINVDGFAGFESPNHPALGNAGAELVYTPAPTRAFARIRSPNVARATVITVRLQPGLDVSLLPDPSRVPSDHRTGIILEAYGSGTAPEASLKSWLRGWREAGAFTVVRSQVPRGSVDFRYGASEWLKDEAVGAIAGYDITNEALYTKLLLLLGTGRSDHDVRIDLRLSLCGEVSVPGQDEIVVGGALYKAITTEQAIVRSIKAKLDLHFGDLGIPVRFSSEFGGLLVTVGKEGSDVSTLVDVLVGRRSVPISTVKQAIVAWGQVPADRLLLVSSGGLSKNAIDEVSRTRDVKSIRYRDVLASHEWIRDFDRGWP